MDEYIKREAAIEALSRGEGCGNICRRAIERILAADVAPVRHRPWIWHSEERGYLCSECGSGCLLNYESDCHKSDRCPHCGAKMDGDDHA